MLQEAWHSFCKGGTHFGNQNKEEASTQSWCEKASHLAKKETTKPTNVSCGSRSGARASGISSCCSGMRGSPSQAENKHSSPERSVSACAQLHTQRPSGRNESLMLKSFHASLPLKGHFEKTDENLTNVNINHVFNDELFLCKKLAVILQMCIK